MANKTSTKRGLFIIESLKRDQEESMREGVIIQQILRLSRSLPVKYVYIRTKAELVMAMKEFEDSSFRYLHLSCHGSKSAVRSMNFVDDISGMLRRILVSIHALSDDERTRVLEHILNADPSYASLIVAIGPGKRTSI